MKTIYKTIIKYLGVLTFGVLLTTSCVSYLDKAPAVNIKAADVFATFPKAQGFMEDVYQCVVDVTVSTSTAEGNWNLGLDEGIMTDTRQMSYVFELGNYSSWTNSSSFFNGNSGSPTNSSGGKGYWTNGWYGIRKCNIAIANENLMVNMSDQERNVILGQAYFLRAYLHFEILRNWGHIAYIDTVYAASDLIQPATITYKACADKIDADLKKAIPLLPVNWDDPLFGPGTATAGKNQIRVTKGAAWAYVGLNALYAGSPLMAQDATSPNNPDSTKFDVPECQAAAAGYLEVIKLALPTLAATSTTAGIVNPVSAGSLPSVSGGYDLQPWSNYFNNFYTNNSTIPLGPEVIWSYPTTQYKRWDYGDFYIDYLGSWGTYLGITQNYVENFGMQNGLPIFAAGSGYDPNNPWVNRDPRFYNDITIDGDQQVKNFTTASTGSSEATNSNYVQFYIGGRGRNSNNSLTGYGYRKFKSIVWNSYDNLWGGGTWWDVPKVRLAGVLLEFAEAANEAYGPTGAVPGTTLTAVQAVNMVRARVMCPPYTSQNPLLLSGRGDSQNGGTPLPPVDARFTSDPVVFRQIIRQERAVELAFEGHRWEDARRWGVASTLKYREKYEYQFDKAHTFFKRVLARTSAFEPKHWWLPFPTAQVALYPAFKQNPGW